VFARTGRRVIEPVWTVLDKRKGSIFRDFVRTSLIRIRDKNLIIDFNYYHNTKIKTIIKLWRSFSI